MPQDSVIIAANPRAGKRSRRRQIEALAERLRTHALSVEIVTELDRAERLADHLHADERLLALVAAGGDGTLAELMNRTRPGTPLAIYPCGTANLVATYVGVTREIEPFVALLRAGTTLELDAGRANGRLFLAVCSCGFDAEVVRRLHDAREGNISMFSYAWPIVRALRRYAFPTMRVFAREDGAEKPPIEARWAFVSNLPCYAMGLLPGAGARGDDGQVDLCALARGGLRSAIRYLPALVRGTQQTLPDCTMRRADGFRIECIEAEVPYELDGDPGGFLPVEIDVLPRRLTLLVPPAFDR